MMMIWTGLGKPLTAGKTSRQLTAVPRLVPSLRQTKCNGSLNGRTPLMQLCMVPLPPSRWLTGRMKGEHITLAVVSPPTTTTCPSPSHLPQV